jgi:ABC-type nickel/cobalt efflux system permease component RcnA
VRRSLVAVVLVIVSWLALAPAAEAHPLGNFTANRCAELVVEPGRVTIRYALDLAEIPAFQTLHGLAPDRQPSPAGLGRWADRTAAAIADRLVLRIDDRRSTLSVDHAAASIAPGQGGLPTLRLDASFSARLLVSSGRLSFADRNDPGRLGWREIVAHGSSGVALTASDVPIVSVTDRLRSYPEDLLSAPLDVTSMEARFGPGPSAAGAPTSSGGSATSTQPGVLDRLLARPGAVVVLLGLVVALALGAWHALLPGHGKTLMAAAAVAGHPRPRDAVVAGISVAGMHTLSVIVLGLVIVVLEQAFQPEAVYPWLRIASGMAAVGVGAHLVRRRWRARGPHGVVDPHAHGHGDARVHGHERAPAHEHGHEHRPMRPLSRPGLAALALAGGVLPSPSALLVLLASLQRGRAVYGLALVLSFSVGLAASLILVGLGAMRARHLAERRSWNVLGRVVPIASAMAVVAIGLVIAGGAIASL